MKEYSNSIEKSRKKEDSTSRKAEIARANVRLRMERRDKALGAFSIREIFSLLELGSAEREAVCPFCASAGVSLNDSAGSFRCSVCKKKGDVLSVVRQVKDLGTWEAIAFLEKLAGERAVPASSPECVPLPTPDCAQVDAITQTPISAPTHNAPVCTRGENQVAESAESLVGIDVSEKPRGISDGEFREYVREVKSRHRVEDIVGKETGAEFKRVGQDLVCRCVFRDHEDSSPSFHITPEKGLFHCFGCGKAGDVFSFLMLYRPCKFLEALGILDGGEFSARMKKRGKNKSRTFDKQASKTLANAGGSFNKRTFAKDVSFASTKDELNAGNNSSLSRKKESAKEKILAEAVKQPLGLEPADSSTTLGMTPALGMTGANGVPEQHKNQALPSGLFDKQSAQTLAKYGDSVDKQPDITAVNGALKLVPRLVDFFHHRLLEGDAGKAFLKERGLLDAQIVNYFKLGAKTRFIWT